MNGIGASLEATHELILHYEVINDKGKVSVLEGTVILMTDIKCRLLIPQDRLMDPQILNNPEGSFTVSQDRSVLKLSGQVPITINYEQKTQLNMPHNYKSI